MSVICKSVSVSTRLKLFIRLVTMKMILKYAGFTFAKVFSHLAEQRTFKFTMAHLTERDS